ncbi:DUF7261 family protein [Haloarcula sp. GH36]|uniref:DUF7261 family protein n=1 Tax=Haloarcula montana TaxID=3111776 RepID=UPI002D78C508|nr:hypothetical protein [Haloarcula sp. GH36]
MADLSADRGQIILIAAFALAVTFIALALVVNAAIFTENLASRGETAGSDDALLLRHSVEQSVGRAVTNANTYNSSTESALNSSVDASVDNVSQAVTRQQSVSGRIVTVSGPAYTHGTQIVDNASGGSDFRGAASTDNWTVATGVNARAYTMRIYDANTAGGANFGGTKTDEFRLNVTDGSDTWRVNVTEQASGDVAVGVNEVGGDEGVCTASPTGGPVDIDLTGGRVGGEPCAPLAFAEGVGSGYDIEYNNSHLVSGNYSLVVDQDEYTNGNLTSGIGTDEPGTQHGIYAVTVTYRYDGSSITYETEVRVAPGEPA